MLNQSIEITFIWSPFFTNTFKQNIFLYTKILYTPPRSKYFVEILPPAFCQLKMLYIVESSLQLITEM